MQTNAQTSTQTAPRKGGCTGKGVTFKPGKSGNPYGTTLAQRIAVQLTRQFVEVHGRTPSVVETNLIAAAAHCGSVMQRKSPKVLDADRINATNSFARHLRRLGLADTAQRKRSGPVRARDVLLKDDKS